MTVSLIDRLRLYYRRLRVKHSLHRNDALGALHRAWGYVHATQLAGDYYEFGVFRGTSLVNSWLSFRHFRTHMENSRDLPFRREGSVLDFLACQPTFYGFDTFSGMPGNEEGDDCLAADSFSASRALVEARCRVVGLTAPRLKLVEGLFADNRDAIGSRPAAIVYVDCDLYASAVDALSIIEPLLVQGTAVLFDDYNLFRADRNRGERRAVAEFQQRTGIVLEPWFAYGTASQAFLCHRAAQ